MERDQECIILKFCCLTLVLLLITWSLPCLSSETFGRISLGVFESNETFNNSIDGAPYSDYLTSTGRIFLHTTDLTNDRMDFLLDLRDKYDSFGSLNATKQELDPLNSFQVRNAYFSNFLSSHNDFNYILGRFSLPESGGAFTDGGGFQKKFSSATRAGVFGGMNPYLESTQIVSSSTHATDFGAFWAYEPKHNDSGRNFILNQALVDFRYDSSEDRRYFYQNFYYQWAPKSRILWLTYLDFVPDTRMQTGTLNYDQKVSDSQVSHLRFLAVDAVGYRRIQNIRSTLASSPYEQGQVQWDFLSGKASSIAPVVTYGHREYDGLTKTEGKINFVFNDFRNSKYDATFYVGTRKNFVSRDTFGGASTGYYSQKWEVSGNLEFANEIYTTQTLTPVSGSLNLSYVQNKDLFYVFSGEVASDQNVTIYAGFVRFTYRFGSKETAPLRDGAPVRGNL